MCVCVNLVLVTRSRQTLTRCDFMSRNCTKHFQRVSAKANRGVDMDMDMDIVDVDVDVDMEMDIDGWSWSDGLA